MRFRLLIDFEVLELALNLPKRQQAALFRYFASIRESPGHYSDYVEVGPDGRVLQVSLYGDYLIKYWIDDADRHVKILKLVSNE